MWWFFAALAALGALTAWCAAPSRQKAAARAAVCGRTFAHRGLYAADQSVPENSLPAFYAAAQAGYGVELDVQLTRDGRVVVFHDDTLLRACGMDARVDAFTFDELAARMRLFGTAERIPLLTEAFDALGGRAPLIVELKTGGDRYALCARTLKLLRSYGGPYCVESFDPYIVRWFYRNAPDVMRGQLAEQMRRSRPSLGLVRSLLLSRTLTNCLTRPHFVAYRVGPLPWPVRLCAALGALLVGWTARPDNGGAEAAMRAYGAVIFEHCRPPARY